MAVTSTAETASDEVAELSTPRRTRIDSPHEAGPRAEQVAAAADPIVAIDPVAAGREMLEVIEEPADELVAAVIGDNAEVRREQLQLQVAQLAGHLRERLREVDRREAQLHARAAQVEAESRASRLWLTEREAEAHEREAELRQRIEELEERRTPHASDSDSPSTDHEDAQRNLADREQQVTLRENELRERRHESDRQAVALRHAQQLWEQQRSQQQRELTEQRAELTREFETLVGEREAQLQRAEHLVQEQIQQLDADRAALSADRQSWAEHQTRQRQALEDRLQAADDEVADRRQRLEARQDWIERQKAGLEQVRGEILALHRQSLEMRLLAEQLWSQITGRLTPAEVTQSIAQLRLKLAEQYKLEEQSLATGRAELLQLGERIAQQHQELHQLRSGLREWAAARQTEIEQQAATLVQRELTLDEQQEQHRRDAIDWSTARRRYEQQIRELTNQLRTLPVAA